MSSLGVHTAHTQAARAARMMLVQHEKAFSWACWRRGVTGHTSGRRTAASHWLLTRFVCCPNKQASPMQSGTRAFLLWASAASLCDAGSGDLHVITLVSMTLIT